MIISVFTSKYKVMAITMFGLSLVLCFCLLFLISPNILKPEFWNSFESMGIFTAAICILSIGSTSLLKMKSLRINSQWLIFQNYVLTYNVKEVPIERYDFYKIVHEETENGKFEAVWLIKDGKMVDSFSNYQYTNYEELKLGLSLENKGTLELSPMKQLFCHFGSKI